MTGVKVPTALAGATVALPFTGLSLWLYLPVGIALVIIGVAALMAART